MTVAKYKQNHTVSVSKKKNVVLVTEHNCNFLLRKGTDTENTTINIWEVLESYGHRPLVLERYGQRWSSFGNAAMEMNSVLKVRMDRRVVSKRFGQR